jgi:hypothetical protein
LAQLAHVGLRTPGYVENANGGGPGVLLLPGPPRYLQGDLGACHADDPRVFPQGQFPQVRQMIPARCLPPLARRAPVVAAAAALMGSLPPRPAAAPALANVPQGADHYLQLRSGTAAGSLAAGASTGGIQLRIFQASFATMTRTNDYSFNAADTGLEANPRITVYDKGTLIYGTEP